MLLDFHGFYIEFIDVYLYKLSFALGKFEKETESIFSRLNTLCTPLVCMRIAAVATLYMTSEYVISCSVQNCVHCTSSIYCRVQFLYTAVVENPIFTLHSNFTN